MRLEQHSKSWPPACGWIASLCIVAVCLLSSCARSPRANAQEFLQRARQANKQGKVNAAILDYRRAIQYQPKATEIRLELAQVYIGRQDFLSAYEELNEVLKLEPKNWEARAQITKLYLDGGNLFQAQGEAEKLLQEKPGDIPVALMLAQSEVGLKEYSSARSTTDAVLKKDPKNAHGWFLRAVVQLANGQASDGKESLRQAIKFQPDWMQPVAALAGLLLRQNQAAQSESVIRSAIALNPKSVEAQYLLAAFLMEQNRKAEIEKVLEKISVLGEAYPADRGILARYHAATGNLSLAETEYADILKKHPEDSLNRRQLAGIKLQQGNSGAANQLLLEGLKINPNDPQLLLVRGQLLVDKGQIAEGIRILQHTAQLLPHSALPQYLVGLAQLRQGNRQLAEDSLNSSLSVQSDFLPARLVLAELALDRGEADRALKELDNSLRQKPLVVQPYLLHALALVEEGQTAQAEKDLIPLLDEFPQPAAQELTYRTLASLSLQQKRFDRAEEFARKALNSNPRSREGLYLLGLAELDAKQVDRGLGEVEQRVRAAQGWAAGQDVLGELLLAAGRAQQAEQPLEEAIRMDPHLDSARLSLSQAQVAQKQLDQAMSTLQQLAQANPRSAEAYMRMGQVCELKEDWQGAITDYQKSLELAPGSLLAENNLAWLYAEHGGNLDLALKLAQSAKENYPDNPNISDTLGWILVKKQIYDSAVQLLREAVKQNPRKALYEYHLGFACYQAKEPEEAKQALEAALRLQPDLPQAADARQMLRSLGK